MKILIVTQYFYPEAFKSNDLAFELQKRGHQVTVLTGLPNYPEGKIYKGYGFFKNRKQTINEVRVIRSLLCPRGSGGGIRLFINYYSWPFFASIKAFFLSRKEKFDKIIVHETSPIMQFYPALLIKKIHKTPIYFWVLDLWPESLSIAGNIKNTTILNYYTQLVKRFYSESKKILIASKGFEKSILEKGDFANKLEYFPNWAEDTIAEGNLDYPIPDLPEGFKVMIAGNIGEAQDMETIMKAALLLKDHSEIKFILVGDGRKMQFVHDFVEEHQLGKTVLTVGRFPMEAMAAFFSKADLLFVSLKEAPIFALTIPARIQAYMSSGKPILAMLEGEGTRTIEEADCGFVTPISNAEKLAEKLIEISSIDSQILSEKGRNGKKFYQKYFKVSECISNLERILSEE